MLSGREKFGKRKSHPLILESTLTLFGDWLTASPHSYEDNLIDTIYQYSTHPAHPLQELEVFAGVIIGKNGAQSKRQKEYSKGMREKFEEDVTFTVERIVGRVGDRAEDSLERSIACLSLSVEREEREGERTYDRRYERSAGRLRSWGWVAASVCLREVERFTLGL